MLEAKPGDLIVMLYEEFDQAVCLINRFKKEMEENQIVERDLIQENVG